MEFSKLKSSLKACFLLKAVIKLLWLDFCFYKLFITSENKNTEYRHLLYKQRLYKCYNVYEDYNEFETRQVKKHKSAKIEKNLVF